MYKVGYLDDDNSTFSEYQKRLARKEIDLIFVENCVSLDDIFQWVINNSIECFIVDHKLNLKYNFLGTNVVEYINNQIPDLPCIILTNYPQDSEDDNLVVKKLILDRSIMSKDDISEIADILKQSSEVFKKRLENHINELEDLQNKRISKQISALEEERFFHLYKLLRAYGEVDEIAVELLKPEVDKKIDDLMEKLDQYIDTKKK